jgi:hypothetical protein
MYEQPALENVLKTFGTVESEILSLRLLALEPWDSVDLVLASSTRDV